jgi:pimeloyl-ACP methyl ester carboxylesterase
MAAGFSAAHRGGSGPPLLCIHGFTDTWRTWELVLPRLEEHHDVLALTLAGHAGGPPLGGDASTGRLVEALEAAMDEAGFETAHLVGNSLGGYLAFKLAERGRARSVVAFAPGGGWTAADRGEHFTTMHELLQTAAAHADAIVATPEGRRRATQYTTVEFEHIPPELLAYQIRAAARCEVTAMLAAARERGWELDAERITCPVRIVWGTEDKLLGWPDAATRYREEWLPDADWVVLDGVGHCPQLDVPLETAELILGVTAR